MRTAFLATLVLTVPSNLAAPLVGPQHRGGNSPWHEHGDGKQHVVAADDFVTVDGHGLKDREGTVYLTGLNYWSCMNLAADDSAGGNHSRFLEELDQMAAHGVNHLRIMASSEGSPTPQPFRMNPPLMQSPGKYNGAIFVGLDRCLDEMAKRGMRATMTLANEWQWSGGFAQYVSWANDDIDIPYPASWNLSAPPQRTTPGTGWGNYTIEGVDAASYGDFTNFANRFYTIDQAQTWYRTHISTVVNRVNSVNGRKYNEDATIMTWQLANEPQPAVVPDEYLGPYSLELPPAPQDPVIAWVESTSAYIKSLAPKQLVNVGLEGKQGKWYFQAVHNFSTVDYTTTHCWVQNWGIYDMLNSSRANLEEAKKFAVAFVANSSDWAAEIGKPVFLEEFGMARDNWENVNKEYLYLSSASTSHKDEYFETIINAAMSSFKSDTGTYVGTCPWAYGGTYRPETQYINAFGEVWAGDPPHESPGWYDLYDIDEAMDIVHRQQLDIAEFLHSEEGANHSRYGDCGSHPGGERQRQS
ncbi:glycoside hydrolase family 5 protein [Polychaeton citri CBS 116435]|uniref:mannan endo-1,4-beta-mannosidase n=1 Tax=Polychaeton citri CBS 116435 TaxID=1314669 RepID=A0A9P4QER0_9PEZI|nr:glycoside hydrolase family 5 protein [Polychaeton citri CBS 116435]